MSSPEECPAPSSSHAQVGRLARQQRLSRCGPWTGSISLSWGLIRIAESQVLAHALPEAESGRGGAVFEQVPQVILEQLKLEKPLEQASTNLFYKGPHGKHVGLCGPGSYGVLPLRQSSQRQYANGWVWQCFRKILFTKAGSKQDWACGL